MFCAFNLVVSEVYVQCTIYLLSVIPWISAFPYDAQVFSELFPVAPIITDIIIIIIIIIISE